LKYRPIVRASPSAEVKQQIAQTKTLGEGSRKPLKGGRNGKKQNKLKSLNKKQCHTKTDGDKLCKPQKKNAGHHQKSNQRFYSVVQGDIS
jgi:hypothetical protein